MCDDDDNDDADNRAEEDDPLAPPRQGRNVTMENALAAALDTTQWCADQLRLMADATHPYQALASVEPAVRLVWLTAAEFLDTPARDEMH